MLPHAEFQQLLEAGDVCALWGAWGRVAPNMPQPQNIEQAEIVMHMARTASHSVRLRTRAYSHRWLGERSLPSQLPDAMRPWAERLYPQIVEGVGISVNFRSAFLAPAATQVQEAMEVAVQECYADNRNEPAYVQARMEQARVKMMKALFG